MEIEEYNSQSLLNYQPGGRETDADRATLDALQSAFADLKQSDVNSHVQGENEVSVWWEFLTTRNAPLAPELRLSETYAKDLKASIILQQGTTYTDELAALRALYDQIKIDTLTGEFISLAFSQSDADSNIQITTSGLPGEDLRIAATSDGLCFFRGGQPALCFRQEYRKSEPLPAQLFEGAAVSLVDFSAVLRQEGWRPGLNIKVEQYPQVIKMTFVATLGRSLGYAHNTSVWESYSLSMTWYLIRSTSESFVSVYESKDCDTSS